jgi:hypothetical protein
MISNFSLLVWPKRKHEEMATLALSPLGAMPDAEVDEEDDQHGEKHTATHPYTHSHTYVKSNQNTDTVPVHIN